MADTTGQTVVQKNEFSFRGEKMTHRKGEKIGWVAGCIGAFIWVFALSIVFLFKGFLFSGIIGLVLVFVSIIIIFYFVPWRFPSTQYWKLLMPTYLMFALSILWAVFSYEGFKILDFNWWMLLWILPSLIPLSSISKRKWDMQ